MADPNAQINPQDLGSLAGTMDPVHIFTLLQAAQAQQAQDLASRSQQATDAASQAQGQYQQAAGAPPPDIGGAGLIPQLFGNVASVLSGNPDYQRQAHDDVQSQKSALLRARADNLSALKDVYGQKADEAQKAGDLETTEKYRKLYENMHLTLDQVNSNRERLDKKENERLQRRQSERNALINQGVNPDTGKLLPYVDKSTISSFLGSGGSPDDAFSGMTVPMDGPDGQPIRVFQDKGLIGNVKNAAMLWASQNHVPILAKDELKVAQDIQGARDNVVDMLDQLESSGHQPQTPWQRAGAFIGLKAGAIAQVPGYETEASFNTWRNAAIRGLRATAGSGGLRINQREIELAVANDIPLYTDTYAVARQKMANMRAMLNNGLRPLVSNDWRRATTEARKANISQPTKGTMPMIDPNGKQQNVPIGQVRQKSQSGWARVSLMAPMPAEAAPEPAPQGDTEADALIKDFK